MQVQEKDQARKTHYRLAKLSLILILFLILLFILILHLHLHLHQFPRVAARGVTKERQHMGDTCLYHPSTYVPSLQYL